MEYPKALYLKGWEDLSACVTVNNPDEEESARKEGYKSLNESDSGEVLAAKRTRKPKAE